MSAIIDDKQEIGIGGFTALARIRQVINKSLDAPDTFLEDGSSVNDHLIKKPITLEIEGKVTDVFVKASVQADIYRRALAEIGNINKYLPAQTQTQLSKAAAITLDANNVFNGIIATIEDGKQLIDFVGNKTPGQTNQELFLQTLDAYYDTDSLMRIEMPDRVYENMVITDRPITYNNQEGNTIAFKITAKQLRFADVIFSDISEFFRNPAPGDVSDQVSGQESNGLNDSPAASTSIISSIVGIF